MGLSDKGPNVYGEPTQVRQLRRPRDRERNAAFLIVDAIKQHMTKKYGRLPDSVDSIREDRER